MSVFKKQSVVKPYPAFDVVRRERDHNGVINLTAGEVITDYEMRGSWYIGSVVSYALEYNECPIQAYESQKLLGHELYWLHAETVSVTSNPQKREPRILIGDDDIIRFEGKPFTVQSAPNGNKKLVPYTR